MTYDDENDWPIGWEGRDVLAVLRDLQARPGVRVDIKRLWHCWVNKHAALGVEPLWTGLRQLAEAKLIEPYDGEATAIVPTALGFG